MNKKIERGRATRSQIVEVATRLFAEHGYDRTSIDMVLKELGISRGSLYHHFAGKQALFEAVLLAIEADIGAQTIEASRGMSDPAEAIRAGSMAWVRLAGDPVVKRIVLIDAPAVLGWERWREIEQESGLGLLRVALQALADAGRLPEDQVELFAHMMLAALNEVALLIARSPNPEEAQRLARTAIDELLHRLL